ncbi:MAG: type secretion protein IcmF, partial [Proteobacteria bacterium]|nr:type secretion protein IcmF [Pseudomonadota bacterium]
MRLLGFLKSKWFIQSLGIMALCALIWFAGPMIAVAGESVLESATARWLSMAGLVVAWVIYRLIMQVRSARKDQQLMTELSAAAPEKSPAEEASEEEVETLRRNFEEALAVLRQSRGKGGATPQFLYELPWYVIIGAPGSGKTTALVNSGLRFPLSEKLGKNSIKGISGTRNCDWWFTDDAVLLDTAGRYTTQDSHQAVDAAAWQGFLQLVKKYRPRRPLNGVLVTMSLADLLQQTEEERALHARALRRRIQELYETMGVRFPVYLLFTKADLVAGFTDFFADLTHEDRAQVWGETFPAEVPGQPTDFVQRFGDAYRELLQRLNRRSLKRIQEERDVQRRGLILEYPQQMALLESPIQTFLDAVFVGNRYEERFLLRGVYFTSGTQEGTPIDRVLGILASTFHLDRVSAPVYSGRGRSFFLTRLLTEVVFPEAQLAGVDPRVEKRQRMLQMGAYAGALMTTVLVIALWTVSYERNLSAIAQVQEEVDRYRAIDVKPTDTLSNFTALLPRMNAMLAARDVYRDPGWLTGFGLYQGDKLQAAAEYAYENLLKGYFAPAIRFRLRERMQGNEAGSLDLLYQFLQVYLMLGQPDRIDPKVVEPWIKVDWQQQFSTQPEVQAQLSMHLSDALQLRLDPAPLDQQFIAAVRAKLTQVPLPLQLYTRFRGEALLDHAHDLVIADVLGPQGAKVFAAADGRDLRTLTVPGLFTVYGYSELFLKKSVAYVKESVEQNWVLGNQFAAD